MKFVIGSHNKKKILELEKVLRALGIEAHTAESLGFSVGDVEETGTTFEENARLKALAFCKVTGLPAIGDDSGLMVDALGGEPGVYSARYAGENAPENAKIEKLLRKMKDVPQEDRGAHLVSVVCCAFPNGEEIMACGEVQGTIAFSPKGTSGFGFDPVFVTDGGQTFAEMTPEEKSKISHRALALAALSEKLDVWLKK